MLTSFNKDDIIETIIQGICMYSYILVLSNDIKYIGIQWINS